MNPIDRLYAREVSVVVIGRDGSVSIGPPAQPAVLAGSFNPLHHGHRQLLEVAERLTGRQGWFEISIENVDKPDLERRELDRRLEQFRGYRGVLLTRAPTFVEKLRVVPGAAFAIGFDTAVRLVDDRYYGGAQSDADEPRWAGVLREVAALGGSFLVAGRVGPAGEFRELNELEIPAEFQPMFRSIPESDFRQDVSSTELRRTQGPGV